MKILRLDLRAEFAMALNSARAGGMGAAVQFDDVTIHQLNKIPGVDIPTDAVPQFVNWVNNNIPVLQVPAEAPAFFFYGWAAVYAGIAGSIWYGANILKKRKEARREPR